MLYNTNQIIRRAISNLGKYVFIIVKFYPFFFSTLVCPPILSEMIKTPWNLSNKGTTFLNVQFSFNSLQIVAAGFRILLIHGKLKSNLQ